MGLTDLIFPRKCFGCGTEGRYLCKKCLATVRRAGPICPVCAHPSVDGVTHLSCSGPSELDGLISVFRYEGALRKAVLALKYKFASDVAKELAGHLAEFLSSEFNPLPKKAALVPVPISKDRANWRGFNQAEVMGRVVAQRLGWEYAPNWLLKRTKTKPQTGLKSKERRTNLEGAFSLNPGHANTETVVVFDDVWTTGGTLKESTKILKRGGVKTVWGLTLARG